MLIFLISFLPTAAPRLVELNVSGIISLTPSCLRDIRALRELQVLDISGCSRIDDWRALLYGGRNPHIRKLILTDEVEDITDQHVDILAETYPNIQNLELSVTASENFGGQSLISLVHKCPKLRRLRLRVAGSAVLMTSIPSLRNLSELCLDIHGGIFDEPSLINLAYNCPNLTSLCFSVPHNDPVPYFMTDATLELLTELCPKLRRLQIFCDLLSPIGLRAVTKFSHLTYLSLTGPKLCNANMKAIALNSPKLTHFALISPEKLTESAKISTLFKGLDNLKRVELVLDVFTDKDLEAIGRYCPKLEHVELFAQWNFPLTLMSLVRNCKALKSLKLAQGASLRFL